ncbi:alpha-L-fucosidase [Sphingobacterium oryzagri]|uniref:alpha-L-fucosidase n=1 Tax=Sphingobacterium oryzagri TaxID=3025669 RepID=A0ABY7WNL2_9SPHI|nr:alpha-L-fucosidase [Sphingobacterium sp. KACC 22765]WDF70001.1 alpha-L-fucosidase [Sphingobacterium sp. KACC 22765]
MGFKKVIMAAAFVVQFLGTTQAQTETAQVAADKMAWFEQAKLGIFIHWGIYSVNGISESWSFFNNYISHANYLKQLDGFSASNYRPQTWVDLIKASGAKYAVITAKHHDGIALWDSKATHALTTTQHASAKRDLLTPFVQDLKKSGLKTGIYFSLPDWSHPYYDVETRLKKRYVLHDDRDRWANYVNYYQQQLTELSTQFAPDLLWFDGDWEHNAQEWQASQTLALLRKYNPNIIVNSRLNNHGDYETPEQGVPVVRPADKHWELCYTMNDSWGYQPFDTHYKTPNMIIRTLIDCIAMGGNLLLDIGPKADGSLAEEQVHILQELGRWTKKHAEAIYETRAGISQRFIQDKTAFSTDGKTLFIYVDAIKDGLLLEGISTPPKEINVVGQKKTLAFKQDAAGIHIDLKSVIFDPVATVVAVTFDQPPVFTEKDKPAVDLSTVFEQKDDKAAIAAIVQATAAGDNLFQGKLTEDGAFVDRQLMGLDTNLRAWISKHAEVLSVAGEGIATGHYAGHTALSQDKQTLYLFVEGQPTGPIAIKGLNNTIARIRIVGEGSMLQHQVFNKLYWSEIPGIVYIDIPKERLDQQMTIIAVLLDKPIALYREKVGAIESNL